MREIAKYHSPDQRIAVFALAIFMCVFLGPFGTGEDLIFWDRVVFWTIAVTVVGLFIEFCISAALDSRWLSWAHALIQIAIGAAIGSVPGTSFVITLNKVFRPEHLTNASFPVFWLQVSVMAGLVSGLAFLMNSRSRKPITEEPQSDPLSDEGTIVTHQPPRLLQRLPTRLRESQIISLSMQDHYVEISTTKGSEMLLMRLSDAIDLLDGIAGVRTHRSHWAAQNHGVKLIKTARKHELSLSDGRSLPVSISYKAAVENMLNRKGQT